MQGLRPKLCVSLQLGPAIVQGDGCDLFDRVARLEQS